MNIILIFAKRNIKMFFRDKASVFFSFLAIFIIIGLYALFLGDMQVKNLKATVGDVKGIRFLVDTWIMAGIIAVNTVTITLGAFGIMVQDESKKIMKDFLVAPIKRSSLVASYVLSSWVIGFVITIIAFFAGEAYIVLSGGELLPFMSIVKVLVIIALCVFSSSSIVFLLVSFIKSDSAFSTLSTLIGTLIGFLAGIYVPIGVLPQAVQSFIKLVPITHGAVLLRQIFMDRPINLVFANAPASVIKDYKYSLGVDLTVNNNVITPTTMVLILVGTGLVFFAISVVRTVNKKT
ncbi:MAG: ABC transporter permease [Syntrophomonas sp.]|nr:ABC transporter permease [Syntrophomonas sp.]